MSDHCRQRCRRHPDSPHKFPPHPSGHMSRTDDAVGIQCFSAGLKAGIHDGNLAFGSNHKADRIQIQGRISTGRCFKGQKPPSNSGTKATLRNLWGIAISRWFDVADLIQGNIIPFDFQVDRPSAASSCIIVKLYPMGLARGQSKHF